jgi:hypothetical protein
MISKKLKVIITILFISLFSANVYAATNSLISFRNKFFSESTQKLLDGDYEVTINLKSSNKLLWTKKLPKAVSFNNGVFELLLGESKALPSETFSNPTLNLVLVIGNDTSTYSFTSVPYSIQAINAETVLRATANNIYGAFTSTVNLTSDLYVNKNTLYANKSQGLVGIKVENNLVKFPLDVNGIVNVNTQNTEVGYYLNGQKLESAFAWQPTKNKAIFYSPFDKKAIVSIGTNKDKGYPLYISGTLNATAIMLNGKELSKSLDWKRPDEQDTDLFYEIGDVGIGVVAPRAVLDISGAIKLGNTTTKDYGIIRWNPTSGFQGYKQSGWIDMVSIKGRGVKNKLTYWKDQYEVKNDTNLSYSIETNKLGLATDKPEAILDISAVSSQNYLLLGTVNSENILILDNAGKMAIGQDFPEDINTNPGYKNTKVSVSGTVDAKSFTIGGRPVQKVISKGTYWYLNDNDSIYYLRGHVGIGRPDPGKIDFSGPNPRYLAEEYGNTLEIAAPNKYPNEPTKDPAITFSNEKITYTMGVDADTPGIFRVEKGTILGSETPLFVAYKNRFGIGLNKPETNLHVKGNLGAVFIGKDEIATQNPVDGPGTRLIWTPSKAALRIGTVSANSLVKGKNWDFDYLGLSSIGLGFDPTVTGNYSSSVGGYRHTIGGAYSSIIGGQENKVYGDFALALGRYSSALHHGSFVWNDGSTKNFTTAYENQFLINASGGVGIGTAETRLSDETTISALTVGNSAPTGYAFIAKGPTYDSKAVVAITSSGSIGINTKDLDNNLDLPAKLKLAILNGKSSIGTTNAQAGLDVYFDDKYGLGVYGLEDKAVSPAMLLTSSLNIGIGMQPNLSFKTKEKTITPRWGFVQVSSGDISATSFIFPDGQKISTGGPVIVWEWTDAIIETSFITIKKNEDSTGKKVALTVEESTEIWQSLVNNDYIQENGVVTDKFDPADPDNFFTNIGNTYDFNYLFILDILRRAQIMPDTEPTTPNIFFLTGNIGIGTISPNSLLELSNKGSQKALNPIITFDMDGTDLYSFGINQLQSNTFRIENGGSTGFGKSNPSLSIITNNIGIGTSTPESNLHSKGISLFDGTVRINTSNTTYALQTPKTNLNKIYINGEDNTEGGVKWAQRVTGNESIKTYHIFYDPVISKDLLAYIGIGTSIPSEQLHVKDTIKIQTSNSKKPSYIINKQFDAKEAINLAWLNFRDLNQDIIPKLYCQNNSLYLTGEQGLSISDVFTRGSDSDGGYLTIWLKPSSASSNTVLSTSDLYWNDKDKNLESKNNLTVNNNYEANNEFEAQNNIFMGIAIDETKTPGDIDEYKPIIDINTALDRGVSEYSAKSFTGQAINFQITKTNELDSKEFKIKGLNIDLETTNNAYMTDQSQAIGINVDISDVTLIDSEAAPGYKYSAIFMGGNVGNTENPAAKLDISGTVSADRFVISERLIITTLDVKARASAPPAISIFSDNKVGIGTSTPKTELEIIGDVEANNIHVTGIKVKNLDVQNGKFVAKNGKVGMGTSTPIGLWELNKQFNDLPSDNYTSQKIHAYFNDSNNTVITQNLTAFNLDIITAKKNTFGDQFDINKRIAKGINVDLSQTRVSNNIITGIQILSTEKDNSDITQNIAIFRGGNVGIGTSTPTSALVVNGTIKANDAPNISLMGKQNAASFNYLVVSDETINTSIGDNLVVNNILITTLNMKQKDIVLQEHLNSSKELIIGNLTGEVSVINTTADAKETISSIISSNVGIFNFVGVGVSKANYQLQVSGKLLTNFITGTATVTPAITALKSQINNTLISSQNNNIGINTIDTSHLLSIESEPYRKNYIIQELNPENNKTWNSILLQSNTTSKNYAVGINLDPNNNNLANSGSGIIAVRTSDEEDISNSELVFVTDPSDADPQKRITITATGNVILGNTQTYNNSLFQVYGKTNIKNDLTSIEAAYLKRIKCLEPINISTTKLNIPSTFNPTQLALTKAKIKALDSFTANNSYGGLIFDKTDKKFQYKTIIGNNVTVTADFRNSFDFDNSVIPYYSQSYDFNDSQSLYWVTSNIIDSFRIINDDSESKSLVKIENLISSTNIVNAFTAETVKLGFNKRTEDDTTETLFSGVSINISSETALLGSNDKAVGLFVNLDTSLKKKFKLDNGRQIIGKKYAATFLTNGSDSLSKSKGNVGIITSPNSDIFHPMADLHISSNVLHHPAFIVENIDSNGTAIPSLIVSANSYLGIGTNSPDAKITVKAIDAVTNNHTLSISNTTAPILVINNIGKVGIGNTRPKAELDISSTITGNNLITKLLKSNSIEVNAEQNSFVVTNLGLTGIGTTTPESQFHFKESLDDPDISKAFSLETIELIITGNDIVKHSLAGFNLDLGSESNYSWFTGKAIENSSYQAIGINVDLSETQIITSNKLVGIHVKVPEKTYENNIIKSAVFLGGNVGIGISNPEYELDINGSIKANDLNVNNFTLKNINTATFNRLVVKEDSTFGTLYVKDVEAKDVFVIGEDLTTKISWDNDNKIITTNYFQAQLASINSVLINTNNSTAATLYINGNATLEDAQFVNIIDPTIIAAAYNITSNSDISVSPNLYVSTDSTTGYIYFSAISDPAKDTNPRLYMSNNDSNISFINNAVSLNLSSAVLGKEGFIPVFDENNNITDNTSLAWDSDLQNLTIGTTNVKNATIESVASINIEQFLSGEAFSGNDIQMNFARRIKNHTEKPSFSGVSINIYDTNYLSRDHNTEASALFQNNEKVVGLYVDVTDLKTKFRDELLTGITYEGSKYSAIFLANGASNSYKTTCNVGIGFGVDQNNFNPNAQLHIVNKKPEKINVSDPDFADPYPLWVTSKYLNNSTVVSHDALVIDYDSLVSIGTKTPTAQLTIVNTDNNNLPLKINSPSKNLLTLDKNGKLGIGTTEPLNSLHINHSDQASYALYVDTNALNPTIVDTLGKTGIGTANPKANLDIYFQPDKYKLNVQTYLFLEDFGNESTQKDGKFLRELRYFYRGQWRLHSTTYLANTYYAIACDLDDQNVHGIAYPANGVTIDIKGQVFQADNLGDTEIALNVSRNGKVSLGMPADYSPSHFLNVSGTISFGDNFTNIPSWLQTSYPSSPVMGTVGKAKNDLSFMGIRPYRTKSTIYTRKTISAAINLKTLKTTRVSEGKMSADDALLWPVDSINLISTVGYDVPGFGTVYENYNSDSSTPSIYTVPDGTYMSDFQIADLTNRLDGYNITYDYTNLADYTFTWGNSLKEKQNDVFIFETGLNNSDSSEIMRLTGEGNVGIGTSTPQTSLHIKGTKDTTPAFIVGSSATANYKTWLETPATIPIYSLWRNNSGETVEYNDSVFDNNYDDDNIYQDKDGNTFIICYYSNRDEQSYYLFYRYYNTTTELVNTTDTVPDSQLFGLSGDSYITPSDPASALVINSKGYVGINTPTPQVALEINGTCNVSTLINAPQGTTLVANTNFYVNTKDSGKINTTLKPVYYGGEDLRIAEKIVVDINKEDLNANLGAGLVGMNVNLSGHLNPSSVFWPDHIPEFEYINFTGVSVNVSNLEIRDVSDITIDDGTPVGSNDQGTKYSAVFTGGNVGIGTSAPTARLSTLPIDKTGRSKSLGLNARFSSEKTKDKLDVICLGDIRDYEAVPTIAFSVKEGVTFIESKTIYSDLQTKGFLALLASGNPTYTGTKIDYNSDDNNLLYPPEIIGKFILNPAKTDSDWAEYTLPRYIFEDYEVPIASISTPEVKRLLKAYTHKGIVTFGVSYFDANTGSDKKFTFLNMSTGKSSYNSGITNLDGLSNQEYFDRVSSTIINGSAGYIGVNIVTPNCALHIGGDLRIGMVTESVSASQEGGIGSKLTFSGGPTLGQNDSDNNDNLWMARWNVKTIGRQGLGSTEFITNFGENGYSPESYFAIGASTTNIYSDDNWLSDDFVVRCFGFRDSDAPKITPKGMVGVGTRNAQALFHVYGAAKTGQYIETSAELAYIYDNYPHYVDKLDVGDLSPITPNNLPEENLVCIEVTQNQLAGLALAFTTMVGQDSHFINFLLPSSNIYTDKKDVIGCIQGSSVDKTELGVRFASRSADYAEFIPKLDRSEKFNKGDIVGIYGGQVSRKTANADQIMVISSGPIIIGNWQGNIDESGFAAVAFLGQVPVKVIGKVKAGDYIIPSGKNDGIGQAITTDQLTVNNIDSVLGIAWETSPDESIKEIKALIGFPSAVASLITKLEKTKSFRKEIQNLKQENEELKEFYYTKLSDRGKTISFLKRKIKR